MRILEGRALFRAVHHERENGGLEGMETEPRVLHESKTQPQAERKV